MAWSKIGETTAVITAGAGNQSITLPGSPIAGDLVIVAGAADVSLENHIATAGYTLPENGTGANPGANLGYKLMGSTPDTTVDIARHATILKAVVVQIWRGGNVGTILDAAWVTPATGTSANPNSNAITVVHEDSLVVTVAFLDDDDTTTSVTPTGYTNKVEGNTGQASTTVGATVALASKVRSAGSDDPSAWTFGSSDAWSAATISFRVAVAGDDDGEGAVAEIAEAGRVAYRASVVPPIMAAMAIAGGWDGAAENVVPPPPTPDDDPAPAVVVVPARPGIPTLYWFDGADEIPGGTGSAIVEDAGNGLRFGGEGGPVILLTFTPEDLPPQATPLDEDEAPVAWPPLARPSLPVPWDVTDADELPRIDVDEVEAGPLVSMPQVVRVPDPWAEPDELAILWLDEDYPPAMPFVPAPIVAPVFAADDEIARLEVDEDENDGPTFAGPVVRPTLVVFQDSDDDHYVPPPAVSDIFTDDEGPVLFTAPVLPVLPQPWDASEEIPGGTGSAVSEDAGGGLRFGGEPGPVVLLTFSPDDYPTPAAPFGLDDEATFDGSSIVVLSGPAVLVWIGDELYVPVLEESGEPVLARPQVRAPRVHSLPLVDDEWVPAAAPTVVDEDQAPVLRHVMAAPSLGTPWADADELAILQIDESDAPAFHVVRHAPSVYVPGAEDEYTPPAPFGLDDEAGWCPAVVVVRGPSFAIASSDDGNPWNAADPTHSEIIDVLHRTEIADVWHLTEILDVLHRTETEELP